MWLCSSLSHRRAGNLIYLTPCLCVAFLQLFAARAPWSLTPALPSLVSPWVPNAVASTRGPQNQVIFRDERYSPLHTHPFSHTHWLSFPELSWRQVLPSHLWVYPDLEGAECSLLPANPPSAPAGCCCTLTSSPPPLLPAGLVAALCAFQLPLVV